MDTKQEEDSDMSSLDTKEKSWSADVELVLTDILGQYFHKQHQKHLISGILFISRIF